MQNSKSKRTGSTRKVELRLTGAEKLVVCEGHGCRGPELLSELPSCSFLTQMAAGFCRSFRFQGALVFVAG